MVNKIKYGINVPNFGDYWDPKLLAELASDAEDAGWDGFFLWDHISGVYARAHPEWQVPVGDYSFQLHALPLLILGWHYQPLQ